MHFFKDLSLSAFTAGFVAVLVGFTSSVAIVFQAALALGATPAMVASWMWAWGIGMGRCSLVPSLWLLTQNTNDAIFEPWAKHLEARARHLKRNFKIHRRARLEQLHLKDGKVCKLTLGRTTAWTGRSGAAGCSR